MVFCGHPKVFHLRLLLFNGHWTQISAETKLVELMVFFWEISSVVAGKNFWIFKNNTMLGEMGGWKEGFQRFLFFFTPKNVEMIQLDPIITKYFSTGLKPPRTASVRFCCWGSFCNVSFVGGRLKKGVTHLNGRQNHSFSVFWFKSTCFSWCWYGGYSASKHT